MNLSSVGGMVSALGKLLIAGGFLWPPLGIVGAIVSAVGSVMSGSGADKTAEVVKPEVLKPVS